VTLNLKKAFYLSIARYNSNSTAGTKSGYITVKRFSEIKKFKFMQK